ncbi:hypothetical protein [Actinacidiphila oryziradicis]|uniref:Uncharacterized protein n=1 Tax=Actinacidiphila oryziradicis TaxID=2571141 RepID=A0A4U0RZW1_9ACTN|nr:hypothetical protein [Actinacidiphila oryziradicis]TKA01994.1 hypothetical protein FCI23_39695 [Actinacidiphila oryziradicis]
MAEVGTTRVTRIRDDQWDTVGARWVLHENVWSKEALMATEKPPLESTREVLMAEEIPPPSFLTYEEFLAGTPLRDIRFWCSRKAVRANRERLMSGRPAEKITTDDVVAILTNARGRCAYCRSLAVQGAPKHPETRKPPPDADRPPAPQAR